MGRSGYVILHVQPEYFIRPETSIGWPSILTDSANPFDLSSEIRIERLESELARRIQIACEPPHFRIDREDLDKHLYAFVYSSDAPERERYSGMDDLHAVVGLSRVVHPTSTGDRYCAHVFDYPNPDSPIRAVVYRGMSPDVFVNQKSHDWLSMDHAVELRRLMQWVTPTKLMLDRIHRAYWNHEYAVRSYYLDARWPLIVSGLEALVNVGAKGVTGQFRNRVRQLATFFGISLTDSELSIAYRLRSKLVHAECFLHGLETILPKSDHSDLYDRLEATLRAVIRKSLLDPSFAEYFRDDSSVLARWP